MRTSSFKRRDDLHEEHQKWFEYERRKRLLQMRDLEPDKYDEELYKIVRELGI